MTTVKVTTSMSIKLMRLDRIYIYVSITLTYENKVNNNNKCLEPSEVIFGHTHTHCNVYSCNFGQI